ncbi:MAG: hypothetical protein Q8O47_10685 [Candidatus Bathyarchaeota archaeon]|nr:hypothetical protein [Candidatus Bathyarchaeota archaeon]
MSIVMKKSVPILLVFITSLIFIAEYFVIPELKGTVTMLQNWGIILTAFTLGFGAVNMIMFHGKQVSRRAKGQWPYSLWLLIILVLFTLVGVIMGATSTQYSWLYSSSYFALSATVYSSLGFYMTSGIYRALRAKNAESALLLIVGVIVLARNAPALAAQFPILVNMDSWLSSVPTTSAQRGIMIGAALGAIALGLRTMIGRETGFLGQTTEGEKGG